jgi:tetratricopeptide (TPR) repeat protein
VDIRLKLADACRDKGEHAEALAQFEEILRINPNYIPGRVHYGIALYSAGKKNEAIREWESVLQRNPGNRSAEMYLNLVRDAGKGGES